jgi:hypothetical protein
MYTYLSQYRDAGLAKESEIGTASKAESRKSLRQPWYRQTINVSSETQIHKYTLYATCTLIAGGAYTYHGAVKGMKKEKPLNTKINCGLLSLPLIKATYLHYSPLWASGRRQFNENHRPEL